MKNVQGTKKNVIDMYLLVYNFCEHNFSGMIKKFRGPEIK